MFLVLFLFFILPWLRGHLRRPQRVQGKISGVMLQRSPFISSFDRSHSAWIGQDGISGGRFNGDRHQAFPRIVQEEVIHGSKAEKDNFQMWAHCCTLCINVFVTFGSASKCRNMQIIHFLLQSHCRFKGSPCAHKFSLVSQSWMSQNIKIPNDKYWM